MQYLCIETTLLSEMFSRNDREISQVLSITENISLDCDDKKKKEGSDN
jgi:hypothetical protein